MGKKELFEKVIDYFTKAMPVAETELVYKDPFQLLVAVILSAQCTDKRVNMITPAFFKQFPTAESLAAGTQEDVFALIRSCSYPNNKARNLLGMARCVCSDFKGQIPPDVDDLQKIPGVGRKTANVIASVIFNKPALAVDTHVFRVAARIGLSRNARTPYETEQQLVKYIPEHLISTAHHWLILHGRYVCKARSPECTQCGLQGLCRYYGEQNKPLHQKGKPHVKL
jgi:endonuclease III